MAACINIFKNIAYLCKLKKFFFTVVILLSIHGRQKISVVVSNESDYCCSENVLDFQE